MKKFFAILTILTLAVVAAGPLVVLAQDYIPNSCELKRDFKAQKLQCPSPPPTGGATTCYLDGRALHEDCGMCCFVQKVDNITNWIFYVMTAIAVLLFIYGGLSHMIAMGDPDKASKARQVIIYAIIGLIIALVAKIVPAIVTTLVK
jgi:hypothetical protein